MCLTSSLVSLPPLGSQNFGYEKFSAFRIVVFLGTAFPFLREERERQKAPAVCWLLSRALPESPSLPPTASLGNKSPYQH